MVVSQRDVPDWTQTVTRAAFAVPGYPVTLAANALSSQNVQVDATLHTLSLMLRGVSGSVSYSVTGVTTGFVYDQGSGVSADQIEDVLLKPQLDNLVTVAVQTGAASGVTVYVGLSGDPLNLTTSATLTNSHIGIDTVQTVLGNVSPPVNGTTGTQQLVDPATSQLIVRTNQNVNNYGIQLTDGLGTLIYFEPPRPRKRQTAFPVIGANLNVGNGLGVQITNNDGQAVVYTPIAVVGGLPVVSEASGGFDLVQEQLLGTGFVSATGTAAISANAAVWTVTVPTGQVLVIDATLCLVPAFGATSPAGMQAFVAVQNAAGTELARVNHIYGQSTAGSQATGKGTKVGGTNRVVGWVFNSSTIAIGYLVSMTYHYEIQ